MACGPGPPSPAKTQTASPKATVVLVVALPLAEAVSEHRGAELSSFATSIALVASGPAQNRLTVASAVSQTTTVSVVSLTTTVSEQMQITDGDTGQTLIQTPQSALGELLLQTMVF